MEGLPVHPVRTERARPGRASGGIGPVEALTGRRRLVLLRHGRTAWNAERRFQGQADPPLDDVGRAQAYEVAALVAALEPDLLVSSDALRAMQTAVPIGDLAAGLASSPSRACGSDRSATGRA